MTHPSTKGAGAPIYDDAVHMMEAQGGSFVCSLAACYYCADSSNKQTLRSAFAHYFDIYEERFRQHLTDRAKATGASA